MTYRKLIAFGCAVTLTLCGIAVANQQGIGWHFDLMRNRSYGPSIPTGFITTWVVTNGGSITLPLRSGYTYNMSVDYGDGTVVNVNSNNDPDATHQYTSGDSNRTVVITGTMGAWYFNNGGSKANFRGVSSWEPLSGVSNSGMASAFYGCASATGFSAVPAGGGWTNVTSINAAWANCTGISDGSKFPDVSSLQYVTDLQAAWYYCSSVTNMFPSVSNLTRATSLQQTWNGCSGAKNGFPYVNNLTNVTTLYLAWGGCSGNTNAFPEVDALLRTPKDADALSSTWSSCSGIRNGFPAVNSLTNVLRLNYTWQQCTGNTNSFPVVSNLTKVTQLIGTWYGNYGIRDGFPEVSTLTNCTTLQAAWYSCYGNTNGFPAVSNLTKVTSLQYTWWDCYGSYFSVQSVLGDCLWITGQVKTVERAFYNNYRMTGEGMPLVTAITNSPGYPTGYTITDCFHNCTNLTDWADIPAAFK